MITIEQFKTAKAVIVNSEKEWQELKAFLQNHNFTWTSTGELDSYNPYIDGKAVGKIVVSTHGDGKLNWSSYAKNYPNAIPWSTPIVLPVIKHTTHYLKWTLTSNLSIRCHISFSDKSSIEKEYVLKDHKNKKYKSITPEMAQELIEEFCNQPYQEIIGSSIDGSYRKIVIESDDITIVKE